jgi:hypothetical protein
MVYDRSVNEGAGRGNQLVVECVKGNEKEFWEKKMNEYSGEIKCRLQKIKDDESLSWDEIVTVKV